ncbi:bifunctional 4-hydroxy-2-oxoglutarate aldolase/2-dehydro-3-deoxy-phosphogluconate aldolase [Legionella londiniensis]|uniref:2-dehydro-3-deoxy-phosphogluconate aldolase n=1 Tax=Legionella londiniensis TaxID=45068 RepID=A0A0W0VM63_9GAMM|nr:bifunctional 4-hydroxy-2-oxoglutarate aldolase/2-dehydro-3-deoxy-phosphogluconate aldolase [Legionella londiniensis]KTD21123.1 2-deydro-3-deoxyphosphogluconate aldolase/4-hydroxy-2-oxoglutarate aldolase [Legionella londiniensis]STX93146.1 2-deydro-3-deoxyphosphogluconate aldolase/4-hydroxy-2-oxoglutarate aldolase [Legionella londiniensis]
MVFPDWQLQPEYLFSQCKIIPVLTVQEPETAVALAQALLSGGMNVLEITLRTSTALEIIRILSLEFPQAIIGAGTVLNSAQLDLAMKAGAKFALSPGVTPALLNAAKSGRIPFIPGCSHVSEIMVAMDYGFQHFKLFPAEAIGGKAFLKAIHAPLPNIRFCPTGGINTQNYLQYLNLPNVDCVGGSWMIDSESIERKEWQQITASCQEMLSGLRD